MTTPESTTPPLRALPISSVLDTAFVVYRANLRMLLRMLLLLMTMVVFVQLALNANSHSAIDWNTFSPLHTRALFNQLQLFVLLGPTLLNEQRGRIILDTLISLIYCTGLSIGLIAYVADRYLRAHGTNVYATDAQLLQHWFAFKVMGLGVASVFIFLLQLTSAVWAISANDLVSSLMFGNGDGSPPLYALMASARYEAPWALGAVLCLAVIARFLLTSQIIVLESADLPRALWRSWQLTRHAWHRTFFVALGSSLILGLLTAIPTAVVDALFFIAPEQSSWPVVLAPILPVGADIVELLMFPWVVVVLTILYYDQRIRCEGFDLDVARRQQLSSDVEPLWQRGRERWNQHDYEGALRDFDAALRLAPDNIPALHLRTALKLRNSYFVGALADAEHWVAVAPSDYAAFEHRGYSRLKLNDAQGAQQDFDAARRIAPDRLRWLQQQVTMKMAFQDLMGAMQDLQHILRQSPHNDWAHYHMACINAQWERTDAVLTHLARAIQHNPDWWRMRAQDDADFDAVRTDPRFIALLDTARTSVSAESRST